MLTVFLVVLAVLILSFSAFLFMPLEVGLEIIRTGNKNNTFLRFKIFKIPFKIRLNKKTEKKAIKDAEKEEKKLTFSSFKNGISSLKELYAEQKDILKQMLSYTREHSSIKSVDFEIHFGFDNAAVTGISTGAIWGMGSFLLKVVDSLVGIKKINMQVNPDFDNKIFEIHSKTILIIKPIHLIIIVGQVLKTLKYVNNKINNIKGGA